MYFLFKTLLTALVVAAVSEIARRYSLFAAAIASLPLTSILAMIWLWHDTHDPQKIIDLSHGIFWMIIPSLVFFLALPWLLEAGLRFPLAMLIACALMSVGYGLFLWLKPQL